MPSFNIIKQLYINQLSNKNEGQLSNKSTDSIIDLDEKTDNSSIIKKIKNEKTDNSSIIKKRKEKECNMSNKLSITKEEAYKIRSQNNNSLGKYFFSIRIQILYQAFHYLLEDVTVVMFQNFLIDMMKMLNFLF